MKKINDNLVFAVSVNCLASWAYSIIGNTKLWQQAAFIILMFTLYAFIKYYISKTKSGSDKENNEKDDSGANKNFITQSFKENFKQLIPVLVFSLATLFIVYYDINFDYRKLNSGIIRFIYMTVIWILGFLLGTLFFAPLFFRGSMRYVSISEFFIPSKDNKSGFFNYYLFLLSIMVLTYFLENNILYATAMISTILVFAFLPFIFFGTIIYLFTEKTPANVDILKGSFGSILMFFLISTILYILNHPVMCIIVMRLEKVGNWFLNLF